MGKVFSNIKSPLKNFNLDNRVQKIISQPKPTPAPRHEKDKENFERLLRG